MGPNPQSPIPNPPIPINNVCRPRLTIMDDLVNNLENTNKEESRSIVFFRSLGVIPKYLGQAIIMARPLAYASEVGESLRKVAPFLVKPLYGISIAYVLVDLVVKTANLENKTKKYRSVFCLDLMIWHLGASLIIPAVIIHKIVHKSTKLMAKRNFPTKVITFAPAIIALSIIPFIVHPIDHAVDWMMDGTFRKVVDLKQYE